MKHLDVNIDEISVAMEVGGVGCTHYLDSETGDIVMLSEEMMMYVGQDGSLEDSDFPDWMQDAIDDAQRVLSDKADRFIEIPNIDSRESYVFMEEFVDTIESSSLREKFIRALQGRRPFRRFKDMLEYYPQERERWFAFKNVKFKNYAQEWLDAQVVSTVE